MTEQGQVSSGIGFHVEAPEQRISPGGTAHFRFAFRHGLALPASDMFVLSSADSRFRPAWGHVSLLSARDGVGHFDLTITPEGRPYADYEFTLGVRGDDQASCAGADCVLRVRPCVQAVGKPKVELNSAGHPVVSVCLFNCGEADISVSLEIQGGGSKHSNGLRYTLSAEAGPVDIEETFSAHGGNDLELHILCDDVLVRSIELRPAVRHSARGRGRTLAIAAAFLIVILGIGGAVAASAHRGSTAVSLAFTPASLVAAQTGSPYGEQITVSGGTAPYRYSLSSGRLPDGLSLSSSGLISGMPSVAGSYPVTIQVTDSAPTPNTASHSYTLAIAAGSHVITTTPPPSLSLTPTSLPAGAVDGRYSQIIAASGGAGPYTYSVPSGGLPPGLTLSSRGLISGVPSTASSYSFTVQAADSSTTPRTAMQAYTLQIGPPAGSVTLSPTLLTLPDGTGCTQYAQAFTATGGTAPYVYSAPAGLPPGLSLSSSSGELSGALPNGGSYQIAITATDSSSPQQLSATVTYTLDITASNCIS